MRNEMEVRPRADVNAGSLPQQAVSGASQPARRDSVRK
jgi:hypothetical protein